MPLLHHPMIWPLAGDGEAVELAGETGCEVADVDHLLDLALSLRRDFPGLDGDEVAKRGLGAAQFIAKNSDELAAPRRGN